MLEKIYFVKLSQILSIFIEVLKIFLKHTTIKNHRMVCEMEMSFKLSEEDRL